MLNTDTPRGRDRTNRQLADWQLGKLAIVWCTVIVDTATHDGIMTVCDTARGPHRATHSLGPEVQASEVPPPPTTTMVPTNISTYQVLSTISVGQSLQYTTLTPGTIFTTGPGMQQVANSNAFKALKGQRLTQLNLAVTVVLHKNP